MIFLGVEVNKSKNTDLMRSKTSPSLRCKLHTEIIIPKSKICTLSVKTWYNTYINILKYKNILTKEMKRISGGKVT